jgi:hypothetical protein
VASQAVLSSTELVNNAFSLYTDNQIIFLTLLFQGVDVEAYQCPYKCTHCGGSVETEEKLKAHIERSHTPEHSPYHTELLSASSVKCEAESILPTLEPVKPTKLKSQGGKEVSRLQDSFIITVNTPDGNESDDKHINLVSIDNIKTEAGETDDYASDDGMQDIDPSSSDQLQTSCPVINVKSYPVNKKLPEEQILPDKEQTFATQVREAWEEQEVSQAERMKGKSYRETDSAEEKPNMSVQSVKSGLCSVMSDADMSCSGKAPGVNNCSTKSQLSSSVTSASRQSDDTDARTDILVKEDASCSNVCQKREPSDHDTSAKQLDICKNLEQECVEGDISAIKPQVLKTYSRKKVKAHSHASSGPVQPNSSTIEVAGMRNEESDAAPREPNE